MKKYAFFIEPEGEAKHFLDSWKSTVENRMPGQPYCGHPAHASLLVGHFTERANWEPAIQQLSDNLTSFEITCSGMLFFYDDALTGGGHTATVKVTPSEPLQVLQRELAEVMKGHLAQEPQPFSEGLLATGPYQQSWMKYGFPFVGDHWVPHFTIASIKAEKEHPLLAELATLNPSFTFKVKGFSLWQVGGEEHIRLADFPLT